MTTIPIYLNSSNSINDFNLNTKSQSQSISNLNQSTSNSLPPPVPPKPSSVSLKQSINLNSNSLLSNSTSSISLVSPPLYQKQQQLNSSRSSTSNLMSNSISNQSKPSSSSSYTPSLTTSNSSLFLSSFNPTSQKIKALSKNWSKKGKERLQEGWSKRNSSVSLINLVTGSTSSLTINGNSNGNHNNGNNGHMNESNIGGIKLPSMILGVRVPNKSGECFGLPLAIAVERTRIRKSTYILSSKKKDLDPVKGDEAKNWLPCIAYRCLEYLELWAEKGEEGLYRIPGRSHQIAELRALFDSGEDIDLREIHPGDLDPHAVASLFKSWLREIPESLLSPTLANSIDVLFTSHTGLSATSTQFLNASTSSPLSPSKPTNTKPSNQLLTSLAEIFTVEMQPEQFYLLRGISWHLSRLDERKDKTKMSLDNLRLILSPTLRLSPIFLLTLVEERELLFKGGNEASKRREVELGFTTPSPLISTPTSATSARFPSNRSSSATTARVLPPPFLQPMDGESLISNRSTSNNKKSTTTNSPPHIWLAIDDDSLLFDSNSSVRSGLSGKTTTSNTAARTPIADLFVSPTLSSISTFSDNNTSSRSIPNSPGLFDSLNNNGNGSSGVATSVGMDRSLSRGRNVSSTGSSGGGTSFTNNNSSNSRNLNSSHSHSQSYSSTLSRSTSTSTSFKAPPLPFNSSSNSSFSQPPNNPYLVRLSDPNHSHSHSHSKSTSTTSSTNSNRNSTLINVNDPNSILNPQRYSSESFMSKNGGDFVPSSKSSEGNLNEGEYLKRFSRPIPSVSLPEGFEDDRLGVVKKGEGEGNGDEGEGLGLLSFEERRRFFSLN